MPQAETIPDATTGHEYFKKGDTSEGKNFFDLDTTAISNLFDLNYLGTVLPTQVFAEDMAWA